MLLRTKLSAPQPRRGAVQRARVFDRLDASAQGTLTLLSAPAGYGKTWVVGEWLRARRTSAGWYSLDADDDDPARFWAYLVEALRSVAPSVGEPVLALLHSPVLPSAETFAGVLINDIAAVGHRLTCVIDDLHEVRSAAIHDGLVYLVDNAPANLHLIVTTRADPPWPLARLRTDGRLAELRAADLRFDEEEAAALLGSAGLRVTQDGIERLEARTDGWVAGLRLAVLSMRDRDDPDGFIDAFAGSHRFILDYLTEEVLGRQTEERVRFLVRTSVLERLEGGLCDAVTGTSGGAAMLRSLERENLFTDPLDDERRWYRYHPLFADVLRARLHSSGEAIVAELHARAADWLEANGHPEEAVRHALGGHDFERAARLIAELASATFMVGNQRRFLDWLALLPDDVIRRDPTLALAHAWARFVIVDLDGIDGILEVAAQAVASCGDTDDRLSLEAQLDVMRAWIAYQQGDLAGCIELARGARQRLRPDGLVPPRIAASALGSALALTGAFDEAERILEEARQGSRRAGDVLTESLALAVIGAVELERGRPDIARRSCQDAIRVGTVAGEPLPPVGIAQVLLGEALRALGQLVEAEHTLESGIALCERALGLPEWVFEGTVSLARVTLANGDASRAAALAARADELFETVIVPGGMEPLVARALGSRARYDVAAAGSREQDHGHGVLVEPLSDREVELLRLLAKGHSNQEIADELFLSVNTVKWHARNLYGKLGVTRRTQAVERARELELI